MSDSEKRKRGRPTGTKSSNPRSTQLPVVRVTPEELKAYKAASERGKMTFSAWVRHCLDKCAKPNK